MNIVARTLAWIRAGYPAGVPQSDYQPLLALLRRRLTEAEVQEIARRFEDGGVLEEPRVDVGVEITKVTDETPSEEDIARVLRHLEGTGLDPH
ncbi:DUF3349 domain-containing protein [Falsarthrobacter nasiphocae]|uniref:DUF3349 domain-containing protein n=1 Tax=Falsarthrobacter nasiphocae TaxID=189863 RepID=A0AAE3YGZ3_9MICC|nr:DUF3349 domain-containing protein [Falsarthrobacter nasiphocae]MDR6892024.1 hypothetical protein [Falsarthrobacter nasiphocae]